MKRFGLFLFVLLVMASLGFAVTSTPKTGAYSEINGATASLDYTFDISYVNSYSIGFSTNAIKDLNDTPASATSHILKDNEITPTYVATSSSDLYAYWQIYAGIKPTTLKISLNLKPLISGDNVIHVKMNTSGDGTNNGDFGNIVEDNTYTTETEIGVTKEVFSWPTGEEKIYVAGSQKITLTTENYAGSVPAAYTGILTMTVSTT